MDVKELTNQYPDLVQQIRDEAAQAVAEANRAAIDEAVDAAVNAERERLKGIESIAGMVGDKALLEDAKYGNPINAQELALKALQEQAKAGDAFLDARAQEVQASGTQDIGPDPVSGSEEETNEADIEDGKNLLVNAFNTINRR